MKEHAASVVSDEAFEKRSERWPDNTPDTKEGYFIRDVFDSASRYFSVRESHSSDLPGMYPAAAAETVIRYARRVT